MIDAEIDTACEVCRRPFRRVSVVGDLETFECENGHQKHFMVAHPARELFGDVDTSEVDVFFVPSTTMTHVEQAARLRKLVPEVAERGMAALLRSIRAGETLLVARLPRPSARAMVDEARSRELRFELDATGGGNGAAGSRR